MCSEMPKNTLGLRIKEVSKMIYDIGGMAAVLTHYDTDGLSAGGIITRLLTNLEKKFIIRSTYELSEKVVDSFFSIDADIYILLDLGSGDLKKIYKKWRETRGENLIIIDHHKLESYPVEDPNITLLNPELYGLDGGRIGCTSVLTSLAGYILTNDPYYLEIGIVGATGDMQINSDIQGINKHLINEAIKKGVIKRVRDFIFFTNKLLPVHKAITWNYIPYIPNFSGREDIGWQLVNKAGIPVRKPDGKFTTVADLSDSDKNKLLELILQYLTTLGLRDVKAEDFITDRITFTYENDHALKTSVDFSNILSSVGRLGEDYIGILLAAGARGDILEKAKKLSEKRRKILAKYLDIADHISKVYYNKIVIIDFREHEFNPRFSGTISTLYSKSIDYNDKIIIVLSREDKNMVKISSRAPRQLVDEGINLAEIMRELAEKFSGWGGGHNVAAGAVVKERDDILDKILKVLREYVKI